jgi:hypothetical protein
VGDSKQCGQIERGKIIRWIARQKIRERGISLQAARRAVEEQGVSRFDEIAAGIMEVAENMARAGHRSGEWTFVVSDSGKLKLMILDSDWSVAALQAEHGSSIFRLRNGESVQTQATDAGHLRRTGVRIHPEFGSKRR